MAMLLTQILFWKPWRTLPAFRRCCGTIRCAAERSPWLWGGEQITGIKTGGERAGLVGGCVDGGPVALQDGFHKEFRGRGDRI